MRYPSQGIAHGYSFVSISWFFGGDFVNDGAVMRINYSINNRFSPSHFYHLDALSYLIPFIVIPIFTFGLVLKFYLIPIKHIGVHIGYAPANMLVKANYNPRRAGQ